MNLKDTSMSININPPPQDNANDGIQLISERVGQS